MQGIVGTVNALEAEMQTRSDAELRELTDAFRRRLTEGEGLDALLPEAFAVVREASRRTLGKRHFDVQLIGGAALHRGFIAEMPTGEGKTLAATLPAYLNALTRQGVHIVTVNDYLARRDAEWMGAIYRFLGIDVGVVLAPMKPPERQPGYAADVTYGTGNELVFDYLRDNMAVATGELVQRGHHYAIVDDADFVLIDQARTPLMLSGPAQRKRGAKSYQDFARMVPELRRDLHYEVDERRHTVVVTDEGATWVEERLGCGSLYDSANAPLLHHLLTALRAKELHVRDRDYVVRDGEVLLVDELTGRSLQGRRYGEGLHQAIEAKEGVPIRAETQPYATITLQSYFRLYDRLSGMAGMAKTEQAEFGDVYQLGMVEVPTNRPMIRVDHPEVVYRTEQAKLAAVVDEAARRHATGQPVLVGTVSIEKSERVSRLLDERGLEHSVLNAKNHEREAHVIAQAGRLGAVTVATNMAGRGVDIKLGGNPEYPLAEQGTEEVAIEHDEVVQLGGLCVLGTERHESRRADNQLRGRAGRQGDPGESRFYLSLEDDLVGKLSARAVASLAGLFDDGTVADGAPATHRLVAQAADGAQQYLESRNARRRRTLLALDEVLNEQRQVLYETRRAILDGDDPRERVRGFLAASIKGLVAEHCQRPAGPTGWDLDGLLTALAALYPVGVRRQELDPERVDGSTLEALLLQDGEHALERREAELGVELLAELERAVLLEALDRNWREHLYEIDCLQEAIGVLTAGQRDPLAEYRRRTLELFRAMEASVRRETVRHVFYASVEIRT
jgi:preprotein translocase subunit SecA